MPDFELLSFTMITENLQFVESLKAVHQCQCPLQQQNQHLRLLCQASGVVAAGAGVCV